MTLATFLTLIIVLATALSYGPTFSHNLATLAIAPAMGQSLAIALAMVKALVIVSAMDKA